MQKRDRKRYSREFKLEAVRRTQITGKSVAEVARELELAVHHLYKWRAEVETPNWSAGSAKVFAFIFPEEYFSVHGCFTMIPSIWKTTKTRVASRIPPFDCAA